MSGKKDAVVIVGLFIAFFGFLWALVSCTAPTPRLPIYPPGWTPPTAKQALSSVAKPVKTAIISPPLPTIMLTCDFGDGPRDGEHIYVGKKVGNFTDMLTFPVTNQFLVPCDNSSPSFIELRSFVNWPAPYVVQMWTNDDGTTFNTTNFWREGPINGDPVVADFVFVPTGCQTIALLDYGTNLVVTGWAVGGKVYQILSAPTVDTPLTNWKTNGTFTGTNGPYQVPVGHPQDQTFFRSSTQ